jgi:aspartyl-tRNA(Asn)/glutamyl-tRNA(Gln) amidotransferase subunit A
MAAEPFPPGSAPAGSEAAAPPYTTIVDASRAIRSGAASAGSLVEACLERIARLDRSINAFITVDAEQTRADSRRADEEIAAGRDRGPLHGIPISIKDIIDVRGMPTTAASRVRARTPAEGDAPVVRRLREAGAVVVGKTNLHEFALGTTNEDSAFGPVRHPLDPARSPGGSSGGSAASVIAGMALASIGTDTGGSVRIPAAACGLVGLKPAFGDIPIGGVVPLSETLDHVGPLCRSVEDAAILYAACVGAASGDAPEGADLRAIKIGVLRGYFTALLEAPVARAFEDVCARLTDQGAILEEVTIPHADDTAAVYLHIVLAEAAAIHAATLESRPDDYTPNVRIRLEMGRYILAEDYVRARHGRDALTREVDEALAGRSALLLPSLAITAPALGATTVMLAGSEEPIRSVMLRLTQLFNITGHPAISLPCPVGPGSMPVGLQLAGARQGTRDLLNVARAVEQALSGLGARDTGLGIRESGLERR